MHPSLHYCHSDQKSVLFRGPLFRSPLYLLSVLNDVVINSLLGKVDDVEAEVTGLVVGLWGFAVVHAWKQILEWNVFNLLYFEPLLFYRGCVYDGVNQVRGSQPFSSVYPPHTLRTLCVPPGYNFLNPCTPNIIFCIPLCYNFHTLELFAYPLELFTYPLGLKYPRLRNPGVNWCCDWNQWRMLKQPGLKSWGLYMSPPCISTVFQHSPFTEFCIQ